MKNNPILKSLVTIASLSVLLTAGCSKSVMKPEAEDTEKAMEAVLKAGQSITKSEADAAESSDEGKQAAFKKIFVDPVGKAGFDLDRSLQLFAEKYIAKDYTPQEKEVIVSFLPFYVQSAKDLERFGLIAPETAEALKRVRL